MVQKVPCEAPGSGRGVITLMVVKPEAQWYLVEQLSAARGHLGLRDDYEAKQNALAHFAGVVAAFRYGGDVNQDEEHEWYRKILVALGYELPDPPLFGTAQAIDAGDPAKRPIQPPRSETAPVFIRSQPGPDEEFEVYGGKLRVIAIELYDSVVPVRWRASPEPDIALAFPQRRRRWSKTSKDLRSGPLTICGPRGARS